MNSFPDWFVWVLIVWVSVLTLAVLYYQKREKDWYKCWKVAQDGWRDANALAAYFLLANPKANLNDSEKEKLKAIGAFRHFEAGWNAPGMEEYDKR